jgi:hypothetical protein
MIHTDGGRGSNPFSWAKLVTAEDARDARGIIIISIIISISVVIIILILIIIILVITALLPRYIT